MDQENDTVSGFIKTMSYSYRVEFWHANQIYDADIGSTQAKTCH